MPAGEIKVENGVISHAVGQVRQLRRAGRQGGQRCRRPIDVKLKGPSAWTLHRQREAAPRWTRSTKTTGRHQFPIDVRLPGMLTAVMEHPPLFGANAKSFDATAAKQVKGVVEVVETPRGVAVVATDTWAAIKGRRR